uniref:Uncharacterized protein n=1 Tax=Physcomitrium patens TaxID=3218 RepID=A0A2K1J760_PHYPA|nr:hypothetical protein PHYPA_020469 [Physcomitrium patens]
MYSPHFFCPLLLEFCCQDSSWFQKSHRVLLLLLLLLLSLSVFCVLYFVLFLFFVSAVIWIQWRGEKLCTSNSS